MIQPTSNVPQTAVYEQVCRKLDEPGTLIVGIDAGKGRYVACVATSSGELLRKRLAVRGDAAGFTALELELKALGPLERYVAAMEPTGGYTVCLEQFLRDVGVTGVRVHPLKVKSNRRTLDLSENKSDDRDAVNIVDLVRQKKFYVPLPQNEANRWLLAAVREYGTLVVDRARLVARLRLILEEHFPELERAFTEVPCKTLLAVLKRTSHPEAIRRLPLSAFFKEFQGEKGLGKGRLEGIYRLALHSVGCRGLEEVYRYRIGGWVKAWEGFEIRERETVAQMEVLAKSHPAYAHLDTIPGVGPVTIAVYLAHMPAPDRFTCASRVVKFFGLDVVERSSGQWQPTQRRISKRGSPVMRKSLYNAALACLQHNGVLRSFYDRLVDRGKRPKIALVAIMAKLLRILFALHRDMADWNPDRA